MVQLSHCTSHFIFISFSFHSKNSITINITVNKTTTGNQTAIFRGYTTYDTTSLNFSHRRRHTSLSCLQKTRDIRLFNCNQFWKLRSMNIYYEYSLCLMRKQLFWIVSNKSYNLRAIQSLLFVICTDTLQHTTFPSCVTHLFNLKGPLRFSTVSHGLLQRMQLVLVIYFVTL